VHPNPLEPGEDGREFVATLEGETNLLDGGGLEIGLELKTMEHGGESSVRSVIPLGEIRPKQPND